MCIQWLISLVARTYSANNLASVAHRCCRSHVITSGYECLNRRGQGSSCPFVLLFGVGMGYQAGSVHKLLSFFCRTVEVVCEVCPRIRQALKHTWVWIGNEGCLGFVFLFFLWPGFKLLTDVFSPLLLSFHIMKGSVVLSSSFCVPSFTLPFIMLNQNQLAQMAILLQYPFLSTGTEEL